MIALDTNVLIYAHRDDATWHDAAWASVRELAEGVTPWAIPWPCIHEFVAIATHPRIWSPPTPLDKTLDQVAAWFESPSLTVLSETTDYWEYFSKLVAEGRVTGARVHDARVAALCLHHGAEELWTADRDFSRFPALKTRNPLLA